MSLTNFNASGKTKVPACCTFGCCGNKFGRIGRHKHSGHINRITLTRRYAKRAERNAVRAEVVEQLNEVEADA
jgi:hypothetical protein